MGGNPKILAEPGVDGLLHIVMMILADTGGVGDDDDDGDDGDDDVDDIDRQRR